MSRGPRRALVLFALLATATLGVLALPVGTGLFLGAMCACTMIGLHRRLERHVGAKPAALLCATLAVVLVLGAGAVTVTIAMTQGKSAMDALPRVLKGAGTLDQLARAVTEPLRPFGIAQGDLTHRLSDQVSHLAEGLAVTARALAVSVLDGALALGFLGITIFVLLVRWNRIVHWAQALCPLEPHHTRDLVSGTRILAREVLLGTVVVGLAQGILAGIGYRVCGLPQSALLGLATGVASLVPAVGTLMVWVPAGLYLLATGSAVRGIGLLVWGALVVVGACDGLLRPRIVAGRQAAMGFVPTLVSLFGGVKLFGVLGLLLGPMLMGTGIAVLRLYLRERGAVVATDQKAWP